MLEQLYIKNIALIDEVTLEFGDGLNILSGETGAGKSVIIGSVNFVLGGKTTRELIRADCDCALVTALFSLHSDCVCDAIRNIGIDIDDDRCILISRSINSSGKTSTKINGGSVTVSMLKIVSLFLIDIHGQHEHQSLLSPAKHIELLDKFCDGQLDSEFYKLGAFLKEYKIVEKNIQSLSGDPYERLQRIDLLEFQINEIESAKLKIGEDELLLEQRKILSSTEKLLDYITSILELLHESDTLSASDRIAKSITQLSSACYIDESLNECLSTLVDVQTSMEDVIFTCSRYADNLEHDPDTLYNLEMRLDLIYSLKKKYGNSIEDILAHYEKVSMQLDSIKNSEEEVSKLVARKHTLTQQISTCCEFISAIRKKYALDIEKQIELVLHDLGMVNAQFKINIEKKNIFTSNGWDLVEFLISPNLGEELKPLAKIASGGEMSRVMLAIKTALADKDTIESFIFDEIDTGVSGRTAQQVAEKMAFIAKTHQVLCITHLPQIAAMADNHFLIEKKSDDSKTTTSVIKLTPNSSIRELARLIGGAKITHSTIAAAKEMKEMATNS